MICPSMLEGEFCSLENGYEKLREAIVGLMPFLDEDYEMTYLAPEYRDAIKKVKDAIA